VGASAGAPRRRSSPSPSCRVWLVALLLSAAASGGLTGLCVQHGRSAERRDSARALAAALSAAAELTSEVGALRRQLARAAADKAAALEAHQRAHAAALLAERTARVSLEAELADVQHDVQRLDSANERLQLELESLQTSPSAHSPDPASGLHAAGGEAAAHRGTPTAVACTAPCARPCYSSTCAPPSSQEPWPWGLHGPHAGGTLGGGAASAGGVGRG
jgi:hypothetical protein